MNKLKGSLYVKFNVLNVGMIFILGLFMSILFLFSMNQYMERQLDLLGREIASAMSQSISNAILVDDRLQRVYPWGFQNGTCLQGQLMKTGSSIVMKGLYGKSSIPLIRASSDISASV